MSWRYQASSVTSLAALVHSRISNPQKLFIRNADNRKLTYGDFWRLSGKLAQALVDAGVKKEDRVALQVEKSPEVIALYIACARLGAVFLPLNTAYTLAELEYFLSDAEPVLIVTSPERVGALSDLAARKGGRLLSLGVAGDGTLMDLANSHDGSFADADVGWDDLIAMLYTSGTTGRPKGAMLTHANLASNALALVEAWQFGPADTLLHALPVFHTHGLFTATNTVLLSGGTMLFLPKFDVDEALRLLPESTTMMGVPTFYTRLLESPKLTREATQHVRLFISGSAPLLAETHSEFATRTGHAILERFGMTETNMNASNPYDGARIAGTVGLPLPEVEIRVTDPASGATLPRGHIGILEVRGPNVFKGYWRLPDKTAEEFRKDGFFITGDLGRFDESGYISIVGRGKDLIITGGFNVYPKEIETEIDRIAGVVESAVIGLPHRDFGEGVTAVVVANKNAALAEAEIQAHLQNFVAKFKLPKRVLFVDELPRNAMGKVQKALLRKTYENLYR